MKDYGKMSVQFIDVALAFSFRVYQKFYIVTDVSVLRSSQASLSSAVHVSKDTVKVDVLSIYSGDQTQVFHLLLTFFLFAKGHHFCKCQLYYFKC